MATRKKTTKKKAARKPTTRKAPAKKAGKKKTTAKKATRAKKAPKKGGKRHTAREQEIVVEQIRKAATEVHRDILKKSKPDLAFPVRSLKRATSRSDAQRRCARSRSIR
jgi:hypothetical protein